MIMILIHQFNSTEMVPDHDIYEQQLAEVIVKLTTYRGINKRRRQPTFN